VATVTFRHQRLEFKEAKTQFDNRRLYQYCVALANKGGGHLVIGVADKPPRPTMGAQALQNPAAMAEKLFQSVGFQLASRRWCILADECTSDAIWSALTAGAVGRK
jgi:predicted HTH transcriptional regulator